ncbi:hypothetical protein GDO81_026803 [Engystomops pustulosus]|uniref:Ig-like domain-containing protein n=1 Tax=Engystomops pustulosus TaxID=76066 RepID=A0AAV6Z4U2_ENGPU|nr:hypothetical protein GDO81_026803 [Engystomops pustulosus]
MTQTPGYISVFPGETVTISCTSSEYTGNNIAWYQQKPGERPKLLIYGATNRHTGVPDRFSGVSEGNPYTNYKLTVKVTEDDAADYYCQQGYSGYHSDTEPYKNLLPHYISM